MIARLRGVVLAIDPPTAVVDVQGVGFRVWCSQAALDALTISHACDLHTRLIVREDELSLYGFCDEDEAELFGLLLSVPGVGARTALALLSRLASPVLRQAIATQQAEVLSRVPGVGKKTAEKIIFALKDKLTGVEGTLTSAPRSAADAEVIAALTSLGYSLAEAQRALAALPRDEALDLEEKIRRALAYFG